MQQKNLFLLHFSGFLNRKTREEQTRIQKQLISSIIAAKVIESGDKDSKISIVSKFIDNIKPDDIADKRLRDFITQAKRQISKADDPRYQQEVLKLKPDQRKSILQLATGMAKAYALDVIATRPRQQSELDLFSSSSSSVFVEQPVRANDRRQGDRSSSQRQVGQQRGGLSGSDPSEETNLQFLPGSAIGRKKTMRMSPPTRTTSLNASEVQRHGDPAFKDDRSSSFSFQPQVGQQRWGLSRSAFTPTGSNETGRGETARLQPLRTAVASVMQQQRGDLNGNEDASLHSSSVFVRQPVRVNDRGKDDQGSSSSSQPQAGQLIDLSGFAKEPAVPYSGTNTTEEELKGLFDLQPQVGENPPLTRGNLAEHDELQSADKTQYYDSSRDDAAESIVSEQSERPDGNGESNSADDQGRSTSSLPSPKSVVADLNSAQSLQSLSQVQGVKNNSESEQKQARAAREQARTARLKHFGVNQSSNGHGSGGGRQ